MVFFYRSRHSLHKRVVVMADPIFNLFAPAGLLLLTRPGFTSGATLLVAVLFLHGIQIDHVVSDRSDRKRRMKEIP